MVAPTEVERHRGAIRLLLVALGAPQAAIGLWALLAPRSFHGDFPVGADGWVAALGPFDRHLVTDVGALFVALGFLMCFAAATLRRETVLAATVTWLIFAVPHAVWHLLNLEPYDTVDAIGTAATVTWIAVAPIAVLALLRRRAPGQR